MKLLLILIQRNPAKFLFLLMYVVSHFFYLNTDKIKIDKYQITEIIEFANNYYYIYFNNTDNRLRHFPSNEQIELDENNIYYHESIPFTHSISIVGVVIFGSLTIIWWTLGFLNVDDVEWDYVKCKVDYLYPKVRRHQDGKGGYLYVINNKILGKNLILYEIKIEIRNSYLVNKHIMDTYIPKNTENELLNNINN